eukprot:scpid94672/ scgid2643/ 
MAHRAAAASGAQPVFNNSGIQANVLAQGVGISVNVTSPTRDDDAFSRHKQKYSEPLLSLLSVPFPLLACSSIGYYSSRDSSDSYGLDQGLWSNRLIACIIGQEITVLLLKALV